MSNWKQQSMSRIRLEDITKPGFSTPWDAPTIPPFPFSFRGVEVLTVAWRTDIDAVARVLPPPLEPQSDIVLAHFYNMRDADWLGENGGDGNVMVGCHYPDRDLNCGYSPYLFASSDSGMAHGREVHGQPKKIADCQLQANGDLWVGVIRRNGIDILTATMAYKQHADDIGRMSNYFDFATNLNLKAVDHIDATPAIRQLTARRIASIDVHECWSGPCTVELRPNAQAPVYRLPVVEALEGFWWRADFTLQAGEIVHDYLAG